LHPLYAGKRQRVKKEEGKMMKTYTETEKRKLVKEFEARPPTMSVYDMIQKLGVSDASIYAWRKQFRQNGIEQPKVEKPEVEKPVGVPVTGLEFNVVQTREVSQWFIISRTGRFAGFKEGLVAKLQELRATQSLTFSGPKDGDKKEVSAIHHAAYVAIKKANLPFKVHYSHSRNLFVVQRREEIK
jgi:transposase-like protein